MVLAGMKSIFLVGFFNSFFSKGDFKYLPCSMVEGDEKFKHCRLFKNSFHDAVSCLLVNVKIAIESDLLASCILGDAYR